MRNVTLLIPFALIICVSFFCYPALAQFPPNGVATVFTTDSPYVNGDRKIVTVMTDGSILMGKWEWSGHTATVAEWATVGVAPIDPSDILIMTYMTTSPNVNNASFIITTTYGGTVLMAEWGWSGHLASVTDWTVVGQIPVSATDGVVDTYRTDSPDVNGDNKLVVTTSSGEILMGEWQWIGRSASLSNWTSVGQVPGGPVEAESTNLGDLKSMFR